MQSVAEKGKIKMPISYQLVADIIPIGKQNAILLRDIATITSIPDNRNLYEIIEQLIIKYNMPIVGSRKGKYRGYYMPANDRELHEARITLRNTIKSLEKRYQSVVKNYNDLH